MIMTALISLGVIGSISFIYRLLRKPTTSLSAVVVPPAPRLVGIETNPGPVGDDESDEESEHNSEKKSSTFMQGPEMIPSPNLVVPLNSIWKPSSVSIPSTSTLILSLPSIIISQLSEHYLTLTDLCLFGRTCKLLFGDVKQCKILHSTVNFERAVHAFTHTPPVWTIGRIFSVRVESDQLVQLNQLCSKLIDSPPPPTPTTTLAEGQSSSSKPLVSAASAAISSPLDHIRQLMIECDNPRLGDGPFRLPPRIISLHLSNQSDDRKTIPITKFILPDTLTRIEWSYGHYANDGEIELRRIPKWPRDLTELVGVRDRLPIDGLEFPPGLLTLTFDRGFSANFHLVQFPTSITNLELTLGATMPFNQIILPTSLKRLQLTVDYFSPAEMPSLAHLPQMCENLQLHLAGRTKLNRIEIPNSIKQLALLLESYPRYARTSIAYFGDTTSLTSLHISRFHLSQIDWTKFNVPQLIRLKIEPSTKLPNQPLQPNELPPNLLELDLSGMHFWVPMNRSWMATNWASVLSQRLRTIHLYSYKSELFSTLCLPTSITSISFRQCFDGQMFLPSMSTIQCLDGQVFDTTIASNKMQPPRLSMLPKIKLIDLGATHPSTLEAWSQSFPEAQVSGNWTTLSSDGHTELYYRLTYSAGGRLMDRLPLSYEQKFGWKRTGRYFASLYDTFPSPTVVADTPPSE